MKKYLFSITIVFISLAYVSCNNSDSTKNEAKSSSAPSVDSCEGIGEIKDCGNPAGLANIIVKEADAGKMMLDFIKNYRWDNSGNEITALETVYWIDKNTFLAIDDYLKTELDPTGKPKYDGLRLYMACSLSPGAYPNPEYKHKSGMYIFPTKLRMPAIAGKSDHEDNRIEMKLSGGITSPYVADDGVANPQIKKFEEVYRRVSMPPADRKENFSQAIWIDACVVSILAKLLKLPNAYLDGVNVNLAAYSSINSARPSQIYPDQSTVILVPTNLIDGAHTNNWRIVDCLSNHITSTFIMPAAAGGFNHGELCPNACN